MAKQVLYACINPANGNSLYSQNISEADILEFMIANFGIDEQLISLCHQSPVAGRPALQWHVVPLPADH